LSSHTAYAGAYAAASASSGSIVIHMYLFYSRCSALISYTAFNRGPCENFFSLFRPH